jgi:hypothetical protein
MIRQELAVAVTVSLLLAIAGCAPIAVGPAATGQPSAAPPSGTSGTSGTSETSGLPAGALGAAASAVADSTPSPAALRVLASIPEPLTPVQRALVPNSLNPSRPQKPPEPAAAPSDTLPRRHVMPAPEAASDTLRIERSPEVETSPVPIPAPTQPLGSRPSPVVMPDTAGAAPGAVEPAPAGSTAGGPAGTAAPAGQPPAGESPASTESHTGAAAGPAGTGGKGPCWRIQVAAPVEREKAESRLEAAQSLLVVPMAIVIEKGLFKVRTRDCMAHDAAEALKKRAVESGFADVFLVDTSAPAAGTKSGTLHPKPGQRAPQHRRLPPSKRKVGR